MTDSKKSAVQSKKWAIITLHPWMPSRSEQIARARAWGVEESMLGATDVSALIVDDVRRAGRTTNWMAKLAERADFIRRAQTYRLDGDQVFFATPLCAGPTEHVARQTVEGLWSAGALVYIHAVKGNGAAIYAPGDDMTEFFEAVRLAANAAHQSAYRAKV